MYSQIPTAVALQTNPIQSSVMSILNHNVIPKNKIKKAIIQAMGMAACQCKCLRCTHCSDNHCGNRS